MPKFKIDEVMEQVQKESLIQFPYDDSCGISDDIASYKRNIFCEGAKLALTLIDK